jgi:hypothetical protein
MKTQAIAENPLFILHAASNSYILIMGLMLRHTQNALQHTKKNKNNFLLTNTQKKFFKAKGLIFLFANTQNI